MFWNRCKPLILILFLFHLSTTGVAKSETAHNYMFGDVTLKLPKPDGYCVLGNTKAERKFFEWTKDLQLRLGSKILEIWLNCKDQKLLQSGVSGYHFNDWITATAGLSGAEKAEIVYPKYDPEQYKRMFLKDWDLDEIGKEVDEIASEIHAKHFSGPKSQGPKNPIDLGVLAFRDFVYLGMILTVRSQTKPALAFQIKSFSLIKGVPVSLNYMSIYENQDASTIALSNAMRHGDKTYEINLID